MASKRFIFLIIVVLYGCHMFPFILSLSLSLSLSSIDAIFFLFYPQAQWKAIVGTLRSSTSKITFPPSILH